MSIISKLFGNYSAREIKRIIPLQQRVLALEEEYKALSDAELKAKTIESPMALSGVKNSSLEKLLGG